MPGGRGGLRRGGIGGGGRQRWEVRGGRRERQRSEYCTTAGPATAPALIKGLIKGVSSLGKGGGGSLKGQVTSQIVHRASRSCSVVRSRRVSLIEYSFYYEQGCQVIIQDRTMGPGFCLLSQPFSQHGLIDGTCCHLGTARHSLTVSTPW